MRARSAASLSFFESRDSYGDAGSVSGSGGLGVTLNIVAFSHSEAATISLLNERVAAVRELVDRISNKKPARPKAPSAQPP